MIRSDTFVLAFTHLSHDSEPRGEMQAAWDCPGFVDTSPK